MSHTVKIRPCTRDDVPFIFDCIKGLAEYEKCSDQVESSEEMLMDELFNNPRTCTESLIGEVHNEDGSVTKAGFAIFFHNFSTWRGRRGIYIEDIYVLPEIRGKSVGSYLLSAVAKIGKERNCGRIEWACMDWNTPSLDFYLSEGVGAKRNDGWILLRLGTDAQIDHLAALKP